MVLNGMWHFPDSGGEAFYFERTKEWEAGREQTSRSGWCDGGHGHGGEGARGEAERREKGQETEERHRPREYLMKLVILEI